jgi:hypothetical protein
MGQRSSKAADKPQRNADRGAGCYNQRKVTAGMSDGNGAAVRTNLQINRLAWSSAAILAGAFLVGITGLFSGFVLPWVNTIYYGMRPYPEGAYVSGRLSLTFNANDGDVREVRRELAAFFKARGLRMVDATDLHVAAGLHYRHGALFTFSLAPAKRRRLVLGMRRLQTSAAAIFDAGPVREPGLRSVVPPDPEDYTARADLSYLWTLFPYNRLDWWPPPAVDQPQMVVYKGPLDWHQPEVQPNSCYVFVNPGTDRVYVAADGKDP